MYRGYIAFNAGSCLAAAGKSFTKEAVVFI